MDLDSTGSSSPNQAVTPGGGPRKSVPYGQACTNCSKAKCKCISRGGLGAMCERCQRLGKECIPSVSVRKRAARRPASERTAHLEEKLDDLVSILRAQAAGNPAVASVYRAATNGGDLRDLSVTSPGDGERAAAAAAIELDPCIVVQGGRKAPTNGHALPLPPPADNMNICNNYPNPNPNASYPTPPSVVSSQDANLSISPAEAEETLVIFREQFLEFFPFVYIPRETTLVLFLILLSLNPCGLSSLIVKDHHIGT